MNASEQRVCDAFRFRWLGSGPLPSNLDLRRCGWLLESRQQPCASSISLVDAGDLDSVSWMTALSTYPVEVRRFIVVSGVRRAHDRVKLLQIGFGDAVSDEIDIEELAARLGRTAEIADWLPRQRQFGNLQLDLLEREAYGFGKPVNLNPREFALLWRLADSPNQPVSKQILIQDVWHMGFVPETNSIAVHMSRLRRKLAFAGLEGIIETASKGGYCLHLPGGHGAGTSGSAQPPRRGSGRAGAASVDAEDRISAQV